MITLPFSSVKYCLATVTCCKSLSIGVQLGWFACSGQCENEVKTYQLVSQRRKKKKKKTRTDQEGCGSDYQQPVDGTQSSKGRTLGISQDLHKPAKQLRPANQLSHHIWKNRKHKLPNIMERIRLTSSFPTYFWTIPKGAKLVLANSRASLLHIQITFRN